MIGFDVVTLSRLQFALTALFHFLFVPLTLGLSMILVIMEAAFVMSGREIWRRITKFWGLIFGINFTIGLATGIAMEFQFGSNWTYLAHYAGGIVGTPLAIGSLAASFLEATFVGLFLFGWDRLSKVGHFAVTSLVAIGASLSTWSIAVANGWMQNPVGAHFNFRTMRMELSSFSEVLFNPVAQAEFVHTVAAGYTLGSVFVLAISAWYLLRGRNLEVARRSMTVAASFGLACSFATAVLGAESGYLDNEYQKMKFAAIEAQWHTEKPPAAFTLFGLPDVANHETAEAVKIPWLLGLIATRSVDTPVAGILDLVEASKRRIISGIDAYGALQVLRRSAPDSQDSDAMTTDEAKRRFEAHQADLGFGLLLLRYTANPGEATAQQIDDAAWMTVPNVPVLFWGFRIMVGIGLFLITLFATAFFLASRHRFERHRWFLWTAAQSLPLPWIAAQAGWIVAEYGRQPWAVDGVLPTFLGVSSASTGTLWLSLLGSLVLYLALAGLDAFLIVRTVRRGPDAPGYRPQ